MVDADFKVIHKEDSVHVIKETGTEVIIIFLKRRKFI